MQHVVTGLNIKKMMGNDDKRGLEAQNVSG